VNHDSNDWRPIEILLVEDNPGDVDPTREALEGAKVRNCLHVAEDGETAIEYLYQRGDFAGMPRPGLILLDLNLPKKDGRQVLEEIKAGPELAEIPVVVLTTSEADEDILRSYQLHANCYITKPVNFKQFLNVVKAIEDFWLTIVKLPKKKSH
jgi:CheY-like chemotaxis protein